MSSKINYFFLIYLVLINIFAPFITAQNLPNDEETETILNKPTGNADDGYGILNKGELINCIGNYGAISDAYLQNVIYNFTWPKSMGAENAQNDPNISGHEEDATDDFSFFFATASDTNLRGTGTVIDGYTSFSREDWRGVDGAGFTGYYHCAVDQQRDYLLAPDGTPMLATSDIPESWPAGWMDDEDSWPGTWHPGPTGTYQSLSADEKAMVDTLAGWYDSDFDVWRFWPGKFRIDTGTGKQVPGEFAGDRHVWCIMDDDDNLQGPKVGIVVEMEAICYGRPYAEDFHFYDFTIRNVSGSRLDSCWWGYYTDVSFGDVGEEEFYTYNSGNNPNDLYNVFIQYDPDGQTVDRAWREIGVFGLAVLQSPQDVGVTDAHYNPDGGNLTSDWELWAQITGQPNDPVAALGADIPLFFHGPDPHFDDFSMSWGTPGAYGLLVASGPFSMEAGEKVKATIVVSAASDQAELMGGDRSLLESGDFAKNIQTAQDMYIANFQGPSGPPAPTLYGIPSNGKVTLYWDNIPENKPDPYSGEFDFEGYKIYRSVDNGATWGKSITNSSGETVGYVPIAQFDIKNNVAGLDPVNVNNYLGSNTGIKHVLVDSTVNNGVRYTYSITAYDRGDPQEPIPSYEAPRGTDPVESNVIYITPRSNPIGYQDPLVTVVDSFALGIGELKIDVYEPPENHEIYQIVFSDSPATTFDVVQDNLVLSTININTEEEVLLVNGIQFKLEGDTLFGGVKFVTDEYGRNVFGITNPDTTSQWYVESAEVFRPDEVSFDGLVSDYEIVFTSDSSWAARAGGGARLAEFKVPFSIWNVSIDPPLRTNCMISTTNNLEYDLGENIYVGDKMYTAAAVGDTISTNPFADFPYRVTLKADSSNINGTLPLAGQKVQITTYRGFIPSDFFKVTVSPSPTDVNSDEMKRLLNEVRVVPNPYVVNAQWESEQNERRLRFMFLPGNCDISIFTVAGELVAKLEHRDGTGDEDWSLLTQVGQEISYGLYVYVIEAKDSSGKEHKKIGKFIVIK